MQYRVVTGIASGLGYTLDPGDVFDDGHPLAANRRVLSVYLKRGYIEYVNGEHESNMVGPPEHMMQAPPRRRGRPPRERL